MEKKSGIEVQLVLVVGWRIDSTRLKRDEYFSPGGRTAFFFFVISLPKSRRWKRIHGSQFSAVTSIASRKKSRPQRDRERDGRPRTALPQHPICISSSPLLAPPAPRYMFSYHLRTPSEIPGREREGHRRSIADFKNK